MYVLMENNNLIRAQDTMEQIRLVASSLSLANFTLATRYEWQEEDLDDTARWVLTRLCLRIESSSDLLGGTTNTCKT